MNDASPQPRAARSTLYFALAALVLGGMIFALHGPAISGGLFMDDYAHYRQLRESDWSLRGLTAACRLELVGGIAEVWWLPELTLRFFRPVAFGLMKLTYTLSDWSPTALHAASLCWHWLVCALLALLLWRIGGRLWLGAAVAGLFAVHPAQLVTVQWIACQTELMVTAFLLGATLCFARFRGWPGFAGRGPGGWGWALGAVVLFALALGCRENAVMFPFVLAAVELSLPRAGRRRALALYGIFGLLLVAYVGVRTWALGGVEVPPRPYVIPPSAPDFARFVVDKALYYILGEFFMIPCVPIGGLPYFQSRPWAFYGLAGLALLLLVAVSVRYLRRPPGLLGPAWMLGFMAPLLPVFASPHHLYLPGIGWAVIALLVLLWIGGLAPQTQATGEAAGPPDPAAPPRWRRGLMWGSALLLGFGFGAWTFYSGLAIDTGHRVEDAVVEEILAAPRPLADGDLLYIANLPVVAHYIRHPLEERSGRRGLRVVPLTWAPRLLGITTPSELTWVDDRTAELRVAEDAYFSGPLGLLVRESNGGALGDEFDRTADLGFRVRVLERAPDGIYALRFEFSEPIAAPGRHFFWGSRTRWACQVQP